MTKPPIAFFACSVYNIYYTGFGIGQRMTHEIAGECRVMGKTEKDVSNYRIAYPDDLQQHENNYLEEDSPVLGVGLSGGGIRSATFCLGVFQSFAFTKGLLAKIKYISSVSGGGYFASFLSAAALKFRKQGLNTTEELGKMLRQDNHREAINHLRDRGNYIAPSGMSDYMKIVSMFLRNILVINFVLAVFCMMIFFLAELIEIGIIASCPILSPHQGCTVSLWLFAPPAIFGLFSVPLMLVFWLVRPVKELFSPVGCIIFFIVPTMSCLILPMYSPEVRSMMGGTMLVPFSVYIASALAICLGFYLYISKDFNNPVNRRITRDKLEAIQAGVLKFIIVTVMLGILLSTARCIKYDILYEVIVGCFAIILLISSSAGYLLKKFKGKIKTIELISLMLTVSWMLILAISVEFIVYGTGVKPGITAAIGFAFSLVISIIIESDYKFVNLCSLNFFYKSRLEEAYLGAPFSNPSEMPNTKLWDFYGEGTDFIHLYNVTLNETISGRTGVVNRDHNGIALAIGPCGISLGVKHHLSFSNWTVPQKTSPIRTVSPRIGYRVFAGLDRNCGDDWNPEQLGAASWAAISGAAVSTGMGKQSNCMKSALFTLGNIRLGYWWDSGVMHEKKEGLLHKLFGVQKKLLAEFCCNFKGTADRFWYLSDGGHFENLAGYELIRRRLPLIVLIDGEQYGEYNFDGLACLIRKAEMDFGARIEFFTQQELANPVSIAAKVPGKLRKNLKKLGSLSDRFCIPQELGKSGSKHAAMGTVHYRNSRSKEPGSSLIIYLKASLSDDEELDLQCYHKEHPDFPHQSTGDQFFDENQWESYRKLGEHAGKSIRSIINKLVGTPKRRGRKKL